LENVGGADALRITGSRTWQAQNRAVAPDLSALKDGALPGLAFASLLRGIVFIQSALCTGGI